MMLSCLLRPTGLWTQPKLASTGSDVLCARPAGCVRLAALDNDVPLHSRPPVVWQQGKGEVDMGQEPS